MVSLKVKTYRLKEFPKNSKLIDVGEDIKRFILELTEWPGAYANLLNEIQQIYKILANSFKIYWKDEDDELIRLTNDRDVRTANEFSNGLIKVYVIQNTINTEMQFHRIQHDARIDLDKEKQKHVGYFCSSCRESILGLRYKCEKCVNYNLCEDCFENGLHSEHSVKPISSVYGFNVCDECQSEMTTNFHICKDCTTAKVPLLNNEIHSNPELEGLRGSVFYLAYTMCDECKAHRHNNHSVITKSVLDLNISHQLLQNEIKEKRKKGDEVKSHLGVKCCNCQNNAAFKSTLPYYEEVLLCEECFREGAFKNQMAFTWLSADEATFIRQRFQNNKEYYNKLRFEQLKQQIEHQNRVSELMSGRFHRFHY